MSSSAAGREKSLFLSYSHLDAERIQPYRTEMERQSIPFWYDYDLHVGGVFSNEIAQNIKACYAFVLFLSRNSANSWYVFDELTYARNKGKRIIVIHLDQELVMPDGMELLLGNLHHLFADQWDVQGCIGRISNDLEEGNVQFSKPVLSDRLNHNSELLVHCRQSFEHTAKQLGVDDTEKGIDPEFFCPIYPVKENDNQQTVEIYGEICKSDHRHILLQADGGLGKTYTFLYTMKRLLDCDRPCAYIPCHLFNEANHHDLGLILKMLCQMLLIDSGSEEELNRFFSKQTDKAFILFLDGYNEAVAKAQLASEIIHISAVFPNIKIVVSSRYNDSIFSNYSHYTMKGLNRGNVEYILNRNGGNYRNLTYGLQNLLLIPMFLRLYIRMGRQVDRRIDTAAELMDQERMRVLETVTISNSGRHNEEIERCLNSVFPEFVRFEYCTKNRSMSFYGEQLSAFLKEKMPQPETEKMCFEFLAEYSIIMKIDDKTNTYVYQHEHYRDYWVAYSVFRDLMRCVRKNGENGKTTAINEIMNDSYSQTVLRYIGELSQANVKGNLLDKVLDCMRRDAIRDDELWLCDETAKATAKIIDIYKIASDGNMIGKDFSGLNLSLVQLNGARTCTQNKKALFHGSQIKEQTFVVSMHESAPRRTEILKLKDTLYLVTISNSDLLISTLPDLEKVWRYPHLTPDGSPLTTHDLISSVITGPCILGVDAEGEVWEWDFILKDQVPTVLPVRKHENAGPALKAIPWSDEVGPLIAVQKKDGTILPFANISGSQDDAEELKAYTENAFTVMKKTDTRKTLTSTHLHHFIFWAIAGDNEIQVWKYDVRGNSGSIACVIPEEGIPDYMICVGTEQATRECSKLFFGASGQDDTILILSVLHKDGTALYQIDLPQSDFVQASYQKLKWRDGAAELANEYKITEKTYNRINAASFARGKMLLAASDGCIYQFVFDESSHCFIPDATALYVRISSSSKFAVEDVLYIPLKGKAAELSGETDQPIGIAAVSVDRSVHLIETDTLFRKKKLPGYNDGLRRLMRINDSSMLATSYDGCILTLHRSGKRWICQDKIPVGNWCWYLEKISSSVYAAGYMTGVALVNIDRDEILFRADGFHQKVECIKYLPDIDNSMIVVSQDAVRIYGIREKNGKMRLEDRGQLSLPDKTASYWVKRDGNTLYLSMNGEKESNPHIACYDLSRPLPEQQPELMECRSEYGRIRDIHCFSHYVMGSGLCGNDGNKTSSHVCFWDVSNPDRPCLPRVIDGFQSFIVHSAIRQEEEKKWRIAFIDDQSRGQLHQYILRETADDLQIEMVSRHTFSAKLCDVAFDDQGDLLLTGLNGALYGKPWTGDTEEMMFRNKCYMMTFGTDMSCLFNAVDLQSPLGQILTDFGNQMEKTRKGTRVIR